MSSSTAERLARRRLALPQTKNPIKKHGLGRTPLRPYPDSKRLAGPGRFLYHLKGGICDLSLETTFDMTNLDASFFDTPF